MTSRTRPIGAARATSCTLDAAMTPLTTCYMLVMIIRACRVSLLALLLHPLSHPQAKEDICLHVLSLF